MNTTVYTYFTSGNTLRAVNADNFHWTGTWSGTTAYTGNMDVVMWGTGTDQYMARVNNVGTPPPFTGAWSALVELSLNSPPAPPPKPPPNVVHVGPSLSVNWAYVSPPIPAQIGDILLLHGLRVTPTRIRVVLRCIAAGESFAIGEEVDASFALDRSGIPVLGAGMAWSANSTLIHVFNGVFYPGGDLNTTIGCVSNYFNVNSWDNFRLVVYANP